MPIDIEERYERRDPFGAPFAESFGLHLLLVGALAGSVWLHTRISGNAWGQSQNAGAIQANLVSNAPSVPLPQIQKPTDNVLATETPSPAPAIEKQQTLPAPDLKAIPIPVKQPAKQQPPKKEAPQQQEQKHPQPQQQPKDRANFGEQQPSSMPKSMAQQQGPAAPVSVTGGGGFRFPYYVAIIQRKTNDNWLRQEVDPSTPSNAKAYVFFSLSRDGAPFDIKIGQSSGSASLDQSCLRAVQRVDSYGPLPSAYSGSNLQVSYYCEFTGR